MEVIIWKLCTSKALGNRQRTVVLWQWRDWLASNVHLCHPFYILSLFWAGNAMGPTTLEPAHSFLAPLAPGWEAEGLRVGVWVEKSNRLTDCPGLRTPKLPVSPGLWVLPVPVRSVEQSQSFMPLAAWEQGMADAVGHPFNRQNLSLFCLHRERLNITPVPEFLHQKRTSCPAPLQLLCLGWGRRTRFCPLQNTFLPLTLFLCWYWGRFLIVKITWNGYFGLLK